MSNGSLMYRNIVTSVVKTSAKHPKHTVRGAGQRNNRLLDIMEVRALSQVRG